MSHGGTGSASAPLGCRMRTSFIIRGALAALLIGAAASPAPAQSPSVVDPKGCAPSERLQSDGKMPQSTGQSMGNEPLSDKLARTDGVICPPNVDPEMKAATPDT